MLRAILTAVVLGVIVGEATLDYVFPEQAVIEGYDPSTWKPCPGRKPEKWHKRKAVWYCGPSDAQPTLDSSPSVGASATARGSSTGTNRSRGQAARGGR
jgi:hypothetical protein